MGHRYHNDADLKHCEIGICHAEIAGADERYHESAKIDRDRCIEKTLLIKKILQRDRKNLLEQMHALPGVGWFSHPFVRNRDIDAACQEHKSKQKRRQYACAGADPDADQREKEEPEENQCFTACALHLSSPI